MGKKTANPHIQRLPKNTAGYDYICGDLHGSFSPLLTLLARVSFNPDKDRLICTGDLTHKGPDSAGCLELLGKNWFHCVRGNHEENTLRALNIHFGTPDPGTDAYYQLAKEGGIWLCELVAHSFTGTPQAAQINQLLAAALDHIQSLPKILIVGEKENRYHVVHAGLLKNTKFEPDHPKFAAKCLLSDQDLDDISLGMQQLEKPALLNESHTLGEAARDGFLPEGNATPTYCGHTSLTKITRAFNHIHIDTGAGKPDRPKKARMLTLFNAHTKQTFQEPAGHPEKELQLKSYVKALERAVSKGKQNPPPLAQSPF